VSKDLNSSTGFESILYGVPIQAHSSSVISMYCLPEQAVHRAVENFSTFLFNGFHQLTDQGSFSNLPGVCYYLNSQGFSLN
jgi:hypothetical protein